MSIVFYWNLSYGLLLFLFSFTTAEISKEALINDLPLLVKSHPPRVQVAEHPAGKKPLPIIDNWIMIITCGVKFKISLIKLN